MAPNRIDHPAAFFLRTRRKALALAALAALGLSGCATSDPVVPSDIEVCQVTYGLPYASRPFAACMADRQAHRRRLAADLMANPNFPVPLPPPLYPLPPAVIVEAPLRTHCSSVGFAAACVTH